MNKIQANHTAVTIDFMSAIVAAMEEEAQCDCAGLYGYDDDEIDENDNFFDEDDDE